MRRLIDADLLEKEGWSLHRTVSVDSHTMEYQVKQIAEVPTITPGPQWIPVSERLPEWKDHKNGMVLVCYGNGVILFNCYMEGCWVQGNPVAWMPLPEPYREEDR